MPQPANNSRDVVSGDRPAGQQRELRLLATALVLSMSTWFSTAAVLSQLTTAWELGSTAKSWLIITLQIGFVVGAAGSSLTNLADRIPPRRLILIGATGASLANGAIIPLDAYGPALAARFMTGVFLAAVYPPALKAMSSWYRAGRGYALGVMIGALTLGSALPHLINGFGTLDWQIVIAATSALTLVGGLIAERLGSDGPYATAAAPFDPAKLRSVIANREFRLASLGYFGHMWELYAMWAWIAAFYGDVFIDQRSASIAAFGTIGIGAFGSVYVGSLSDRELRSNAAGLAMRWSALASMVTGFLVSAPPAFVLMVGLVWGFWVVADSAQFSTIVTEVVEPESVGTALTLQLAIGFVLTVLTIFLVPVIRDASNWGFAFMLLAPGPIVGALAMRSSTT
ncbi:MAG: MFS family permease [Acidimicrobiales bacterium]|jgi:MFS family permease